MTTAMVPLKFQVGARTLATIPRRLVRVPSSLADVLQGATPRLPPLPADADGYAVTSLPEALVATLETDGLLSVVRQRYTRYHVDLAAGEATWLSGLSGSTRSGVKRKARKLAASGAPDIRGYRTPAALAVFHPLARAVSATTYQERLMGSGLPADTTTLEAAAAADRLRAWLLFVDGTPVAYLCCTARGDTLTYDHVGHDPAYADRSPGTVLQVAAIRALFADRFAWFDFTEGEGQHKRQFASAGTRCVDLLVLRSTLANRIAVTALAGFDRAMALAKQAATHPAVRRIAMKIRR